MERNVVLVTVRRSLTPGQQRRRERTPGNISGVEGQQCGRSVTDDRGEFLSPRDRQLVFKSTVPAVEERSGGSHCSQGQHKSESQRVWYGCTSSMSQSRQQRCDSGWFTRWHFGQLVVSFVTFYRIPRCGLCWLRIKVPSAENQEPSKVYVLLQNIDLHASCAARKPVFLISCLFGSFDLRFRNSPSTTTSTKTAIPPTHPKTTNKQTNRNKIDYQHSEKRSKDTKRFKRTPFLMPHSLIAISGLFFPQDRITLSLSFWSSSSSINCSICVFVYLKKVNRRKFARCFV